MIKYLRSNNAEENSEKSEGESREARLQSHHEVNNEEEQNG